MNPARPAHGPVGYARKSRRAQHRGENLRLWKAANRFDQITIRFRVAHDHPAERRNDIERIEVIERIERGNVDGGEFETEKSAADLEHAVRFRERMLDARHIADAEGDGHGVEAAVGKRQRFGIGPGEIEGRLIAAKLRRACAADLEHVRVDIADRGAGMRAAARDDPKRDVAGAAGDIEDREWRMLGRVERGH
jgi:hypothetical protein